MRPSRYPAISSVLFLLAAFAAVPAQAETLRLRHWLLEGVYYAEDQPMAFLVAAVVFLTIALMAKANESSGFLILGGFFLTVFCIGVFIVFELTTAIVPHPRVAGLQDDTPTRSQPKPAVAHERAHAETAVAKESVPVGGECRHNRECVAGASCSKVAGMHRCWLPCAPDGGCAEGFACLPESRHARFCVK